AVGGRDGGILLPAWALALDERPLALMLAHERAHLTARDPQLLAAATVAVALMPWNPALWWQLRRLRLAVEIDCDRRVLRAHPDVSTYGALLLDVARRDGPRPLLPAAALSSAATSLERRIHTMTTRRPRHLALRTLGFGALGTVLVVAACEAPHPTGLKPQTGVPVTSIRSVSPGVRSGNLTEDRVRAAIREQLPALARGVGRAQMAWFVEDASGKIVNASFADAAPPENAVRGRMPSALASVSPSTIDAINVLKMAPGRVAPDSTSVIWVQLRAPGSVAATTPDAAPQPRSFSATIAKSPAEALRLEAQADPATKAATTAAVRAAPKPADGEPIFVVNGVVVPTGPDGKPVLPDPSRIESVNVYKGAAAKALFGDSASNGVVKITTKP
ncbi:MAG: hypothetical protein JO180_04765, partial [Gemmatirosa sp.]|nr:hypothetical protein [Gemmatirosa sp.]